MLHEESRPGGNTETAFQTHHHHQAEVRTGHQCSRFDDLAARGRRRAARHRSTARARSRIPMLIGTVVVTESQTGWRKLLSLPRSISNC
jgi:hypothetical protein